MILNCYEIGTMIAPRWVVRSRYLEIVEVEAKKVQEDVEMATRDKSQKIGFFYTNVYELYKNSKQQTEQISSQARVWRAEDLQNLQIKKFEPPVLTQTPSQNPKPEASRLQNIQNPFDDLKANLARLQELHSRLRFMLKELEDLVNKN